MAPVHIDWTQSTRIHGDVIKYAETLQWIGHVDANNKYSNFKCYTTMPSRWFMWKHWLVWQIVFDIRITTSYWTFSSTESECATVALLVNQKLFSIPFLRLKLFCFHWKIKSITADQYLMLRGWKILCWTTSWHIRWKTLSTFDTSLYKLTPRVFKLYSIVSIFANMLLKLCYKCIHLRHYSKFVCSR